MVNNPIITIIIPVYNCEPFLDEAIQSVLDQTYQNFEIILIDDGSTDKSLQICINYKSLDDRIQVIHTANNGPSHARNIGIGAAAGEYLLFLDGDDKIKPETLELIIEKAIKLECDLVFFGMIFEHVKSLKNSVYKIKSIPEDRITTFSELKECFDVLFNNNYLTSACNKLVKRSLIEEHSIAFDDKISCLEDFCFSLDLIRRAKSIVAVKNALYIYIHRERSSLSVAYKDDMPCMISKVNDKINEFAKDADLSENSKYILSGFMVYMISSCVINELNSPRSYNGKTTAIKRLIASDWVISLLEKSSQRSKFTTIFRYLAINKKTMEIVILCKIKQLILFGGKTNG